MKHTFNVTLLLILVITSVANSNDLSQATQREPNAAPSAQASDSSDTSEPEIGFFGDWNGLKTKMLDSGVEANLKYRADFVHNLRGDSDQRSDFLENLDATVELDLEKLIGPKGLSLFLYGLWNHGHNPSENLGDSFGVSNISAPNTAKLYEAYFQQTLSDQIVFVLGVRDLNADFYVTDSSSNLINSAFGISPAFSQTGVNGPSIFPQTAVAATVQYKSADNFYFQAGGFNAQAGDPNQPEGTVIHTSTDEGHLFIGELGFSSDEEGDSNYKYGFGMWSYSKMQAAIDVTKSETINSGFYVLIDKKINSNFSVFAKIGTANSEINQFNLATEAGILVEGPFSIRPKDALTIGYATANLSEDYKLINDSTDNESVLELGYKIHVARGISLTPDYQIIKNVGSSKSASDSEIAIIRFEILF